MPIKNAYPELSEVPFKLTSVTMDEANKYIASLPYIPEVQRAVQIIFRNESANGKNGLCNNFVGQQADGARLADKWVPFIAGTFIKKENMTSKDRRFVAFKDWRTSIALLADRVFNRGIYIGENIDSTYYHGTVRSVEDLAKCYWDEWVMGDSSNPSKQFVKDFTSMYSQAAKLFI